MQKISEAASEPPTDRRDRSNETVAVDPNAKEPDGDRRPSGLNAITDPAEASRKHLELEPDIGPDRGE